MAICILCNVQQSEGFPTFWRDERLGPAPPGLFIEALLDLKETVVPVLVGKELPSLITVNVLLLQ